LYVYVSPVTENTWGEDRLGSSETLADGGSITIPLSSSLATVNRYDIRLIDRSRNSYIKRNVLVSANGVITLTRTDLDGSAAASTSTGGGPPSGAKSLSTPFSQGW
jgi:hypothetical protein